MTQSNPFVLDKTEYKRDINVLRHYVNDAAQYLSVMSGKDISFCRDYVLAEMRPGGKFEFKDPQIRYLDRGENGDRVEKHGVMSQYIAETVSKTELIAPTFTTYLNPKQNQSVLVDFIDENVAARSRAKKAMFKATMANDNETATLKKIEQGNKKISNNSISGAHVSNSTPLFNRTGHSTLTSNCRVTSGFGNANNEKMLCGNRHYWNPNIVINNIISIISNTDYERLEKTIAKYGLVYPSVDETMECIEYSTRLYWRNARARSRILTLVNRLTDLQRAAFVYTGDLYHLKKYNDKAIRTFIEKLSTRVKVIHPNPKEAIERNREEYRNLVQLFFPEEMKGKTLGENDKNFIGKTNQEVYGYVASTIENVNDVIVNQYADFIETFFVTINVPASLAYFPTSIRRAALTSDTDSTIFTVQDWVTWYQGYQGFSDISTSISATMIFLAAETITHILARMSANFGIETKRIHQVAMKNEYYFPVFSPTQVGKHYFAAMSAQEGNVYEKMKMEIKGVHLKSSNVPKEIMKKAEKMMSDIIADIMANKKISLRHYLGQVADVEREIKRSVLAGEPTYFRKGQIKTPQAYTKSAEESPYQYHLFWQEVFAPKYGYTSEPPYGCLKVSVDLGSRSSLKKWVASIKDKALALRLENWLNKMNKNGIQSLLISEEVLRISGMPPEIAEVMDMRKTIFDVTSVYYIILETLGFYCVNKNLTRLISDEY